MSALGRPNHDQSRRVLAYIDGFNVYYGLRHACRDADHHHLKHGGDPAECLGRSLYWLDLRAVVVGQLKRSERCVGIKYFSAPRRVPELVEVPDPSRYTSSNARQSTYLDALRTLKDLEIELGWYSENDPIECLKCGNRWPNFEEKVTDVNIATHMLMDAFNDRFDLAFVLSADADLVPPIQAVRQMGKDVVVGLFPGRKRAKHLRTAASEIRGMRIRYLRKRVLPQTVDREGLPPLECPDEWKLPGGWAWGSNPPHPSAGSRRAADPANEDPRNAKEDI